MRLHVMGESLACIRRLDADAFENVAHHSWYKLIGLRNIISHGYEIIDFDEIWQIITEELPRFSESIASAAETLPLEPIPRLRELGTVMPIEPDRQAPTAPLLDSHSDQTRGDVADGVVTLALNSFAEALHHGVRLRKVDRQRAEVAPVGPDLVARRDRDGHHAGAGGDHLAGFHRDPQS